MKAVIRSLVLFSFTLLAAHAAQAAYSFTWQCDDAACTFNASSAVGTAWYQWSFGDGSGAYGQNVGHTYDFPGPASMSTTVTLTYQLTNGTVRNVSCGINWYEPGIGGDPTAHIFSGTCQ